MNIWGIPGPGLPFPAHHNITRCSSPILSRVPASQLRTRLLSTAAGLGLQGSTIRTEPLTLHPSTLRRCIICCRYFLSSFLLGGSPTSGTLRYRIAASKSAQLPASPRHSHHSCHHWAQALQAASILWSNFMQKETASDRVRFCPKSAVSVSSCLPANLQHLLTVPHLNQQPIMHLLNNT